jgi:GLPGLI family protein
MRYIILITYLFTLSVSFGQSNYESGTVNYGVNFNNKVLEKVRESQKKNNNHNKSAALRYMENSFLNHKKIYAQDITFIRLNFRKNIYLLKPVEIMLPENLSSKFSLKSEVYYGNFRDEEFLQTLSTSSNTYIVPFNKKYDWEIKSNTKNILGFKCRKAVLDIPNNNMVIAWFTPQIPIAFSPVKYYGLPGAILEVTTPLKHIYAKNIEFKEDVEIERPTEGIKLSKEEYQEMMTRFKPD